MTRQLDTRELRYDVHEKINCTAGMNNVANTSLKRNLQIIQVIQEI